MNKYRLGTVIRSEPVCYLQLLLQLLHPLLQLLLHWQLLPWQLPLCGAPGVPQPPPLGKNSLTGKLILLKISQGSHSGSQLTSEHSLVGMQ